MFKGSGLSSQSSQHDQFSQCSQQDRMDRNTELALETFSAQSYAPCDGFTRDTFPASSLQSQGWPSAQHAYGCKSNGLSFFDEMSLADTVSNRHAQNDQLSMKSSDSGTHCSKQSLNQLSSLVLSLEVVPRQNDGLEDISDRESLNDCLHCQNCHVQQTTEKVTTNKLNKAYLRKLDRKFDRLFKAGKFSTGLTNTTKSVYSFEGEVLSEMDDEYNSDSSFEAKDPRMRDNDHEEDQGIDEVEDDQASNISFAKQSYIPFNGIEEDDRDHDFDGMAEMEPNLCEPFDRCQPMEHAFQIQDLDLSPFDRKPAKVQAPSWPDFSSLRNQIQSMKERGTNLKKLRVSSTKLQKCTSRRSVSDLPENLEGQI